MLRTRWCISCDRQISHAKSIRTEIQSYGHRTLTQCVAVKPEWHRELVGHRFVGFVGLIEYSGALCCSIWSSIGIPMPALPSIVLNKQHYYCHHIACYRCWSQHVTIDWKGLFPKNKTRNWWGLESIEMDPIVAGGDFGKGATIRYVQSLHVTDAVKANKRAWQLFGRIWGFIRQFGSRMRRQIQEWASKATRTWQRLTAATTRKRHVCER